MVLVNRPKWRSTFQYLGKFPNGEHAPSYGRDRDAGAICLAVLRRDGFILFDAGEAEGRVTIQTFELVGMNLNVSVDVQHGELHAEILDNNKNVLATENGTQILKIWRVRRG